MSDSTPSPRAKEDGTNKRVRIQQNDNTGKRIKPPENNDNNNMEVTLTNAGQDGNEAISNPNHNPLTLTLTTFAYLHGTSNHPKSIFKGVYKGENVQILRNTSEEGEYKQTMTFLNNQFRQRKYPPHLTNSPIIPYVNRDRYLETKGKDKNYAINFTTTFDPSINLTEVLKTDWPRLSTIQDPRNTFTNPPRITFKHSPNLSQLLVRAKLDYHTDTELPVYDPPPIPPISYSSKNISCRNEQCGTCPQLSNRSHYWSYQTKHYYNISKIFFCDTTNCIYLLDCNICNKQYVGETHCTIRNRMRHHRNISRSTINRPIYAHLKLHKTDFIVFTITIIDQVRDTKSRKEKESMYINRLKTYLPFGLNVIRKK